MIQITKTSESPISCGKLKPFQAAVICDDDPHYPGTVVMRTASTTGYELMNLSNPEPNRCWTTPPKMKAQPCTITITL